MMRLQKRTRHPSRCEGEPYTADVEMQGEAQDAESIDLLLSQDIRYHSAVVSTGRRLTIA
jgi:hypothetical protein